MKSIFLIFTLMVSTAAAAPDDKCIVRLAALDSSLSRALNYFSYLVKYKHFTQDTKDRILSSIKPLEIKDYLLFGNETQKHSLMRGIQVALKAVTNDEQWMEVVAAVRTAENELTGKRLAVEDTKEKTGAIFHDPKGRVQNNGVSYSMRHDIGKYGTQLKDGSFIFYARDNESGDSFIFVSRDKKYYPTHGLGPLNSKVIEPPSNYTHPFILVGLVDGFLKTVGSKGELLENIELLTKVKKFLKDRVSRLLNNSSKLKLISAGNNHQLVISSEFTNSSTNGLIIYDLNSKSIFVKEIPHFYEVDMLTENNEILARNTRQPHHDPLYNVSTSSNYELPKDIDSNLRHGYYFNINSKYYLIGNSNHSGSFLFNLQTKKIEKISEYQGIPGYVNTVKNNKNEEVLYFIADSQVGWFAIIEYNLATKKSKTYEVGSSDKEHVEHAVLTRINQSELVLIFQDMTNNLYTYILGDDRPKKYKLTNRIGENIGVVTSSNRITVFYEDIEAGRPNELAEIEIYGTEY